MISISWVGATVALRVAGFVHVLDVLSDLIGPVVLSEWHRNTSKRNEKARCCVSHVDKWETKDGDTRMSVQVDFRDR